MPDSKRIILLANSRKYLGRCIAGIDTKTDQWVRPIGSREHTEVSEADRQYEDGSDPRVLDVVEIAMVDAVPDAYQSENWLIDPAEYWRFEGRIGWDDLGDLVDAPEPLWNDPGAADTIPGRNDRVRVEFADAHTSSLRLIRVDDLVLQVRVPWDKRKLQAQFSWAGSEYALWVSDPEFERAYIARGTGTFPLGDAYLTVSLAERNGDGYCYKMVAAIITQERARRGE